MRAVALLACTGPLRELSTLQQNPPQQRPPPPAGVVEGESAFGPCYHRAVALLASTGPCLDAQQVPAEPAAAAAGTLHRISWRERQPAEHVGLDKCTPGHAQAALAAAAADTCSRSGGGGGNFGGLTGCMHVLLFTGLLRRGSCTPRQHFE